MPPQIFDPAQATGLSEAEATRRQQTEGFNELPHGTRRGVFTIALEVMREPMFLLLVACGSLYLLMGELSDALMLLGFVFVVMGITIVQERRTERALDALRDLSSPRALVLRDGQQRRIAGREVVRGDLLLLSEGDRVPADAVLRQTLNLYADESLLTGESVPVRKASSESATQTGKPGGDDLPDVFSGSLITRGQGLAEVVGTGIRTELGKIGKALQTIEQEKTPLQGETGRMVKQLAAIGLGLCVVVIVAYGVSRGNTAQSWVQGMLAGIAMAMAVLPEEFPVILTIFLALGAWRISRSRVLTRRMPAIETLGAATVLCTDKTGTLTLNQMTVRQLCADGQTFVANPGATLQERFHTLLEYGVLASKREVFDPMERALRQLGDEHLGKTEHWHEQWTMVRDYPLSPELLALSHVWRAADGERFIVAAKGAPEAIAELCHLGPEPIAAMVAQVARMAGQGLRVLGVARAHWAQAALPGDQHDFIFEFLGLVGLEDPIRPAVPSTVQECYTAGIRVIMITGDHPDTARSIARQIGLRNAEGVITGPELDAMSDGMLTRRIPGIDVFARVVPEQKLRLVNALKANGEIVAMTGDGVNDAPALKAAHIGIAMGGRGTDVAREASALILLDDDFSSIVQAIRLGRRIYDNIKKAVGYTLAIHVPIAGLSMIPVFLSDWPLLLLPVHIVFLELIIDPACSLIFEAEGAEKDIMLRPPRKPDERLFNARVLTISLLQGGAVLAGLLLMYWAAGVLGQPQEDTRRSFVFATLVAGNLGLILTNRSWVRSMAAMFREPNAALWWVVGGATVMLVLVLNVPALRSLLHLAALRPLDLGLCVLAGVTSIGWFEGFKLWRARRQHV
ncbi:cation-translocating P-type ATPase [Humidesulfovibrio sp.]|uniref:cation-translocating P-type ATPase n=1 Tax=Humidesulfovibrio sp. TaxID=2910988 RepID=UPI00280A6A8A|nr:cation-translocating P-type ATPase [Humidesulfovibrio sp.]